MLKLHVFLISVLLTVSGFAQDKILVGVIESPPYSEEKRPNGQGMVCELITSAYELTGYTAVFQFYPLARLFETLTDGKVTCVVLGNLSPVEKEQVIESKPVYVSDNVFFYKKSRFPDGVDFKKLSDLKGFTVSIKNGSTPTINLLTDNGLIVDLSNTSEIVFTKLYFGRTDLALSPDISGIMIISSLGYKHDEFGISKYINSAKRTLVFSKKTDNKLIKDFETGFKEIIKNGTYNKILGKYYGNNLPSTVMNLVNDW
jgi:polar amino acid transport system substrate-binding protein